MSDKNTPLQARTNTSKGNLYDATGSDELRITIDKLEHILGDRIPSVCQSNLWYLLFSIFLATSTLAFSLQPDSGLRGLLKCASVMMLVLLVVLLFLLKPFNHRKMRIDMIEEMKRNARIIPLDEADE